MREEERLRQAAADEPAEDAPRLVLADWLEEHGDINGGTFIRAGVELARMGEAEARYPESLARYRRSARFAAAPKRPWVDHVPGALVSFRRGLIHRASLHVPEYLKHPPGDWRRVPLEELIFREQTNDAGTALAARQELDRLRLLGLMNTWSPEEMIPLLGGSARLAGLRELGLQCIFGHEDEAEHETAMRELADAIDLPGLEGLSWRGGHVLDWPPLVPAFGPLQRLVLESYSDPTLDEDADSWGWLMRSRHWKSLRQANIWHEVNTIAVGDVCITDRLPNFKRSFAACPFEDLRISVDDLPALTTRSWGALHTLRLGHCDLSADLAPLAACQRAAQLRRLFLEHPDEQNPFIVAHQPDVLAGGPHLKNLRHLRIDGYRHGVGDMAGIAAGAYRERLLRLEIGELTQLDEAQVSELVKHLWPELRHLQLGLTNEKALAPLLKSRNLPNIGTLDLITWPKLKDRAFKNLAGAAGMPHLSLVTNRDAEWVLDGGKAWRVHPSIELAERDLFEEGASR